MKRREKVSVPSEGIGKILEIVRLLPAGIELMDFWRIYFERVPNAPEHRISSIIEGDRVDEGSDFLGDTNKHFYLDEKYASDLVKCHVLAECLHDLPSEFVEYIALPDLTPESMFRTWCGLDGAAQPTFEDFVRLATVELVCSLTSVGVIDAATRYSTARDFYQRSYALVQYLQLSEEERRSAHVAQRNFFAIEEVSVVDDRVKFRPDEFTRAFNGVPVDRLNLCDNCGLVYWVRRTGAKVHGCTLACSKILRTRRWREKVTAERKAQYVLNRIEKESIKGDK